MKSDASVGDRYCIYIKFNQCNWSILSCVSLGIIEHAIMIIGPI